MTTRVDLDFEGDADSLSRELSEITFSTNKNQIQAGTAYYVATPIGNLEDITLRAIRTLREVDVIASEDTRVTAQLLRHLGIERKQLVSHHDHNLQDSVPKLVGLLQGGASVAVVSDAGTPGISDPGLALAAACAAASLPILPVPGPCAAVAALSVAGMSATEFVFAGFLPRANRVRRARVSSLATEPRAVVLYEAPHRLLKTLGDLSSAGLGLRGIVVGRELTKLHEEYHRGTVTSAFNWFTGIAEREGRIRGEFTLVVAPLDAEILEQQKGQAAQDAFAAACVELERRLDDDEPMSAVAKSVSVDFGVPKSKVYAEAVRLRDERKKRRREARIRGKEGPEEEDGM